MNSDNQRMSQLRVTRRLRPKVILLPRKKQFTGGKQKTIEQMIAALRVPSSERTDQDVDTLLATVGKWPCFTNAVHSEEMRREVCRQMVYDERPANTVLFRENDQPNGWFIVVSGQCIVVKLVQDSSGMADMPPIMVQKLKESLGSDKYFRAVFTAGPKLEFGSVALIKNQPRNATIYISQPSILIRVDNQIYRDTAAFFARTQLEKRANIFSHIEEFQPIKEGAQPNESMETFALMAENTVEFTLPVGSIIDLEHTNLITKPSNENLKDKTPQEIKKIQEEQHMKTQGFFIVAEGKLAMHRSVDFSEFKQEPSKEMSVDVLNVRLPRGVQSVQIATLGPKTMFPDPRLENDWIPYQFQMVVLEPVLLHQLKLSDLMTAVPQSKLDVIKAKVREQPADKEIIEQWIEKQRLAQWLAFKKQCVKEAQKSVKLERQIMNGSVGMRRSGIPKAIKEHGKFPPLRRSIQW